MRRDQALTLDPRQLLLDHYDLIERAIRFAAYRQRFDPADAEDFAGVVRLRLVEHDYAALRAYEQRSSFRTFIGIVVQRIALDYRIHQWGKWHASAEAKRLGPLAVALEELLHRDGRSVAEAAVLLQSRYDGVTPASLTELAARLPARAPKHRDVPLDDASGKALAHPLDLDESLLDGERRRTSRRVSELVAAAVDRLSEEDQCILHLRFVVGMTVAEIVRTLHLDQKLTYRRIERNLRALGRELENAGFTPAEVKDLIGRNEIFVHFPIGNPKTRPSMAGDETARTDTEAP